MSIKRLEWRIIIGMVIKQSLGRVNCYIAASTYGATKGVNIHKHTNCCLYLHLKNCYNCFLFVFLVLTY